MENVLEKPEKQEKIEKKLQFNIGEKMVIDGAHFIITNLGTYPKGQPMQINMSGDEQAFNVDINGSKAIFRESQIRMLINAAKSYIIEEKEPNLEPISKKR